MASKARHSPAAAALTDLIVEVFRTNGALLSTGDQMTGAVGQSSARWQVLAALQGEAATVPEVARNMGLTRQGVQRVADLLAGDGLAEFQPNPAHKRSQLVLLTKKGRSVLEAIEGGQIDWSNEISDGISQRRIQTALGVLKELRGRLETPPS